MAGALDINHDPRTVEAGRQPRGGPHRHFAAGIAADADQQMFRGSPGPLYGVLPEIVDHLVVDPVGGAAQGQFAQGGEIAGGEKTLGGAPRRIRQIDLALVQALDQFARGDVDQHHVLGVLQHPVGHGLAHDDAGDAADHIGQAFEMLDVQRRPDIDAGVEQLLDIEPALGMAAVGRIGVGELIDDDQLRLPRQGGVEIEFLQYASAIIDFTARQNLQPFGQRRRLGAAMGLDQADHNVLAVIPGFFRAQQHGVGLADPRRRAQKHF